METDGPVAAQATQVVTDGHHQAGKTHAHLASHQHIIEFVHKKLQ